MPKDESPVIHFNFLSLALPLRQRALLKKFILTFFRTRRLKLARLQYVFCSDDYLLRINASFLKHRTYTDIITFNLSGPGEAIEGEIYISLDRVRENAELHGEYYYRELHRVIFHGILHLAGYDDKSELLSREIRAMENKLLQNYFERST